MRRFGNLFDKIASLENLELALKKAKQGKTRRSAVKKVLADKDNKLLAIRNSLINGTYKTSAYHTKTIYEPKERLIFILPFYPDRIVHHAIMNVLEPLWDKQLIYDCYACRKGKGQHKGSIRCMQYVRQYNYCLKCDVSKFYPSIQHDKLKLIVRQKIKDKRTLNLLDEIIDSVEGNLNVPIGNYLSQWFGNLYLSTLDHFCKETLHIKGYIRYCDDFLLFGNDKPYLKDCAQKITAFCRDELGLTLSKCNLFNVSQGVDFLGYRHFRNYILVRKKTAQRIRKRLLNIEKLHLSDESKRGVVASAYGWLKHANTYHFSQFLNMDELLDRYCYGKVQ